MYDLRVLRGADLFEALRRASHPAGESSAGATVMQQLGGVDIELSFAT